MIHAPVDVDDLARSPAILMSEIVAEIARQQELQEDLETDELKMWERFWALCVNVWHEYLYELHCTKHSAQLAFDYSEI